MTALLFCLSMAIYHEARSEPLAGQAAVAHVIINRVESKGPRFPNDVCSVVKQPDQFPFWWGHPQEEFAWKQATMIAEGVLNGDIVDLTGGALYYHRANISVRWTVGMEGTTIGNHIFFTAKVDW